MPDAPPPVPPTPPAPPPTAAPAKKMGVMPKILIGCLGVAVLISLVVGGLLSWGAYKLKRYASNPAAAAAQLIAAGNPDLEVVSQDDARKTVTIHDKKTGKTITVNSSQIEQGKLEFSDEKGEKVTIGATGEGKGGGMTVETKEGTTVIGDAGAGAIPGWVPAYPGAKPEGTFSQKGEKGAAGAFTLKTEDAVAQVIDRYEADLQGEGFQVKKTMNGEAMGILAGTHEDGREVNVTAMHGDGGTAVTVQYASKKQ
jgi:hypothetical protein